MIMTAGKVETEPSLLAHDDGAMKPGKVIGDFRLEEPIGHGTFSTYSYEVSYDISHRTPL